MGIANKDYFLDEHQQFTTDEAKAAFVLIRKGQEIPKEMADKYGIGKTKEKQDAPPAESVKAAKPSADKSVKPTDDK